MQLEENQGSNNDAFFPLSIPSSPLPNSVGSARYNEQKSVSRNGKTCCSRHTIVDIRLAGPWLN